MAVTPAGAKTVDLLSLFPSGMRDALKAGVGTTGPIAGTGTGQSAYAGGSADKTAAVEAGSGIRAGAARFASTASSARVILGGTSMERVTEMLLRVARVNPDLAAKALGYMVQEAEANSPRIGGVWQNSRA